MEIQSDWRELLELLNAHAVEYVIVGAHALAFHGAPRYTGDLDLLVHSTPENARRIQQALTDFGFGNIGLTEEDFVVPDKVVQLGYPPARIDFMTSLSGVLWEEVALDVVWDSYGDVPIRYLGKQTLIKNKKATGRHKDLADIEALGEE
jgi:hypothetical protein